MAEKEVNGMKENEKEALLFLFDVVRITCIETDVDTLLTNEVMDKLCNPEYHFDL